METGKGIFSADYWDDRVYLGGKNYPLGHFTVDLLNQYYENDTVARISMMRTYMERTERTLRLGYLDERDLQKAGEEILYILKCLPNIQPFQMLDMEEERSRIQSLFTEGKRIQSLESLSDTGRYRENGCGPSDLQYHAPILRSENFCPLQKFAR